MIRCEVFTPPVGLEPTAPRLTVGCSNHLSYGGKFFIFLIIFFFKVHSGIRTHNLKIRSLTRYPLRHMDLKDLLHLLIIPAIIL